MRGNLARYAAAWVRHYGRVYRGLLHFCAWALTTAAAATLSWFGVHSVLRGTAYDPPRALPVTAPPLASSERGASPVAPPAARTAAATAAPRTRPATRSAAVRGWTLRGGRVVLALGPSTATLVSAVPNAGWRMQVWPEDGWLRVTFTLASGGAASTLFCTWNGHAPAVESYEQ